MYMYIYKQEKKLTFFYEVSLRLFFPLFSDQLSLIFLFILFLPTGCLIDSYVNHDVHQHTPPLLLMWIRFMYKDL